MFTTDHNREGPCFLPHFEHTEPVGYCTHYFAKRHRQL